MNWLRRFLNRKKNFNSPDAKIFIKSGDKFFDTFEFYIRQQIAKDLAEFSTENESFVINEQRFLNDVGTGAVNALILTLQDTATYKDKK